MDTAEKIILLIIVIYIVGSAWALSSVAFAQLSVEQLSSILEDREYDNCEFIVIAEGMYRPVRIEITYPSTDQVIPNTRGLLRDAGEFSANFGNTKYSFETNATENFEIDLRLIYDDFNEDQPRQVYYEFITQDSIRKVSGNWEIENNIFCKVINFWTDDAPEQRTEEELAKIFNEHVVGQYETLEEYAIANADILVFIGGVAIVSFLIIFAIVYLLWRKSESSSREMVVVKNTMKKSIEKFDKSRDKLERFVNFNQLKIADAIGDLSLVARLNKHEPATENIPEPVAEQVEEEKKPMDKKIINGIRSIFKKEEEIDFQKAVADMTYSEKCKLYDNYLRRWNSLSAGERAEFDLLHKTLQEGEPR